jgi:hypothetical protein
LLGHHHYYYCGKKEAHDHTSEIKLAVIAKAPKNIHFRASAKLSFTSQGLTPVVV